MNALKLNLMWSIFLPRAGVTDSVSYSITVLGEINLIPKTPRSVGSLTVLSCEVDAVRSSVYPPWIKRGCQQYARTPESLIKQPCGDYKSFLHWS